MKTLKKTLSVLLAIVMALAVCGVAFAEIPENYAELPKEDLATLEAGAYWYDVEGFIAFAVESGMQETEANFYRRASYYLSPDFNTLLIAMQSGAELEMGRDAAQFAPYFTFLKQHEGGDTPCAHTNMTATPAKEANCTEPGNSAYWTCADCGLFFADANAANGIEANSWVIGVNPNNHDFNETIAANVTVVEPTCAENGSKTVKCANCSETKVTGLDVDPANHDGGTEIRNAVAATCTAAGSTGDVYCLGCNRVKTPAQEIKAAGHTWGEWTVTKEATETEKGEKTRECSVCHEKQTEAIPSVAGQEDLCKWCGEPHEGVLGKIVAFFHFVLYFFAHLFGKK